MKATNHNWGMNHREWRCDQRSFGANTDLLGEEGHDGEDDQRHENAVRPKLQLVPVDPPKDGGKGEDKRNPPANNTSVIGRGRH